jgi:hypothetical protein
VAKNFRAGAKTYFLIKNTKNILFLAGLGLPGGARAPLAPPPSGRPFLSSKMFLNPTLGFQSISQKSNKLFFLY